MNPGCYGSVTSHDAKDPICKACECYEPCRELIYDNLQQLRKELDVEDYARGIETERSQEGKLTEPPPPCAPEKPVVERQAPRRRVVHTLSPEQKAMLEDASIPKKPREMLGVLFRRGFDKDGVQTALKRGENPFASNAPRVLAMAADLLLQGGFKRGDLRKLFADPLVGKMSAGTANAQVSIVARVMLALDVVVDDSGLIKVKD